jgi:hypothetical protein
MAARRRLSPELASALDSFREVYSLVDRARSSLTQASPTARFAGRPLPDVLVEFEEHLGEASARMTSWRRPELEPWWRSCRDALAAALRLAERLRLEAPAIGGFEGLVGVLGDLLSALDPFDEARAVLRSPRTLRRAAANHGGA